MREGRIKEVEVTTGNTQSPVPDDAIRKIKIAADLTVAGTGAEAVVEVLEINGNMCPVMGGECLG